MEFQTPWNRIKSPAEPGGGGTVTSQAYIPAAIQILSMIEAGKRLDAFRRDLFDSDEGEEPELEPVALRALDVDLVDVQGQVSALEERLAAMRAAAGAPGGVMPAAVVPPAGVVPPAVSPPAAEASAPPK